MGYHQVKLDSTGHIVPWYGKSAGEAYDHLVRLVWAFWRDMRSCSNGVPVYLQHQVWTPDKDDSRGLGGDQISMPLSSWNLRYDYLGDEEVKNNMTRIADYWLGHGMSKPTDLWANLPHPYNTDIHSGRYDGDMRAGKNFLQPDKAGSFGAELVTLYKIRGNRKYLDAAIGIADSLAAHIRPGDAANSPWPFRVNALTGEVHRAATKPANQSIQYDPKQIRYTKFDRASTELFKLGAAAPKSITGGPMKWNPKTRTLVVVAKSSSVAINLK
jgi:hypothetical protein